MCIHFKPPSLSDPRLPIQAKPKRFHGNTMKLFCQLANDDFMALWITALHYTTRGSVTETRAWELVTCVPVCPEYCIIYTKF